MCDRKASPAANGAAPTIPISSLSLNCSNFENRLFKHKPKAAADLNTKTLKRFEMFYFCAVSLIPSEIEDNGLNRARPI